MNAVKAILILKHIGYAERSLEELFEGFEGLNMDIVFHEMRLSYKGQRSFGKKRAVYMYCSGGRVVSLSPFSYPLNGSLIGYLWTNSDKLADSVIKEINSFFRDDLYSLYEEEEGVIKDFGAPIVLGRYADCMKYAESKRQNVKYIEN
jgi:hypothetical protein